MRFAYILGENPTFPAKNPTFSANSSFSPPKFLMSFLVINSKFYIFHFYPLIFQKLRKQQLIPYFFCKKHLLFSKNHYVPKETLLRNLKKKQKNPSFS